MSHRRHHAIIVSGNFSENLLPIHNRAKMIFGEESVSAMINSKYNEVVSFYIAPDGSSEGWAESQLGDERRDHFIKWMEKHRAMEGGLIFQYLEVQFADDYGELDKITRGSQREEI